MNPNPYEQTVRVVTIFFSAVTGLGLKELLERDRFGNHQTLQALCFAAAFLLLLRFLFGSANHLWAESNALLDTHYSKLSNSERVERCPAARLFVWHLFCLIIYFLLMMLICYAGDIWQFLFRTFLFSITASVLALVSPAAEGKSNFSLTGFWFWTNVVQAIAAVSLCYTPDSSLTSRSKLLVLVVLFLVILLWDVGKQITHLEDFCRKLKAGAFKTS